VRRRVNGRLKHLGYNNYAVDAALKVDEYLIRNGGTALQLNRVVKGSSR
jgi:hypothetical protein